MYSQILTAERSNFGGFFMWILFPERAKIKLAPHKGNRKEFYNGGIFKFHKRETNK